MIKMQSNNELYYWIRAELQVLSNRPFQYVYCYFLPLQVQFTSTIQERSSSVCSVSLRVRLARPLKTELQLRRRQEMRETVPCSSLLLPVFTSPRRRGAERATAFSSLLRNKERTATFPKRKSCEASLKNVTVMAIFAGG